MPPGFIPDEGSVVPGAAWLRDTSPILVPWQLILWVNDIEPEHGVVWADLTEATWAGYARVTLTRSMWSPASLVDQCQGWQWGSSPYAWTYTGSGEPINYGWAVLDDVLNELRFVQRFDADDIGPVSPGKKFRLLPRITTTNSPCAGESLSLTRLTRPRLRKAHGK